MNERSFTPRVNHIKKMMNQPNASKREQILSAAERVFAEQGIDNASVQMVADKAQVAAGTIYRYFNDKADLIQQLYTAIKQHHSDELFQVKNANGQQTQLSPFEQYRVWWQRSFELIIDDPAGMRCYKQFELSCYFDIEKDVQENKRIFAPWFHFLHQEIRNGVIKDLPDELLTSLSLESSHSLAIKHHQQLLILSSQQLEAAVIASWNAIATTPLQS